MLGPELLLRVSLAQVICWERGRPARKRAVKSAVFLGGQSFRASRSLGAGRPRSQPIT
jgi:hypothetical protein